MNELLTLDHSLFLFLNTAFANPVFDIFFRFITTQKNWTLPLVAGLFLFFFQVRVRFPRLSLRPDWRLRLHVVLMVVVSVSLTDLLGARVLKPLFGRLRPCHPDHLIEGARYLIGLKRSLAFPSLHAMNMFGVAAVLTGHYRTRWPWFYVIASLVAFSRVYCGVHYPIDIAGGALAGTLVGAGVYYCGSRSCRIRRFNPDGVSK